MNYPIILALNLTKNPQNRHFCALLPFGTPVFWLFEHKIGVFVSEWAIFPLFSSISSTKSAFLCSSYRRRLRRCWSGGGKCGLGEEKSAHILGLRAFTNLSCCSECRSTRSAAPPPAGQGTKGQETKSRGTKAWERRAGGFTGGRG